MADKYLLLLPFDRTPYSVCFVHRGFLISGNRTAGMPKVMLCQFFRYFPLISLWPFVFEFPLAIEDKTVRRAESAVGFSDFLGFIVAVGKGVSLFLHLLLHMHKIILGIVCGIVRIDQNELHSLLIQIFRKSDQTIFIGLSIGAMIAGEDHNENRIADLLGANRKTICPWELEVRHRVINLQCSGVRVNENHGVRMR